MTLYGELDTPAVLVDLDTLEANLASMAARTRAVGVKLRPHAKTHKSTWIAGEQLRHGASGLTVAKLGEAEAFADGGADDLLVTMPIVGASKLLRLRALAERIRVIVNLDDEAVADALAEVGRSMPRPLEAMVEVDCGQGRCGRLPGAPAADLAERVAGTPGLRLRGLLTFAGHASSGPAPADRERVAFAEAAALSETAAMLEARGVAVEELSFGSTPTSASLERVMARFPGLTEMRAGTYVFHDARQVWLEVADEADCALSVLVTVVSRPAPDRMVVDAGTKTLAADRIVPGGFGRVRGHPDHAVEALTEEHGVIRIPPASSWHVGDRLEIIPNHACPVPNLAEALVGVRGGAVERTIAVEARGRNR